MFVTCWAVALILAVKESRPSRRIFLPAHFIDPGQKLMSRRERVREILGLRKKKAT
jgi:hypothetical protein